MRLCLFILCLGLLAVGEARAAKGAGDAACARDNLWAEQVTFAEAALVLALPGDEELRCSLDGESVDGCIDAPGLSAARPMGALRCDVRFGGAPRLHLRAARRPSPFARALLASSPRHLQPAGPSLSIERLPQALPAAALLSPLPPLAVGTRLPHRARPLPSGHRSRIERPPR